MTTNSDSDSEGGEQAAEFLLAVRRWEQVNNESARSQAELGPPPRAKKRWGWWVRLKSVLFPTKG